MNLTAILLRSIVESGLGRFMLKIKRTAPGYGMW